MKMKAETFQKIIAALIIVVSLSAGMTIAFFSGALEFLELKLYDFRVNLFASSSRTSDDIILILLDQDSLDWGLRERGWGWPWPRTAYAELIDYMNLSGAKSLAFDVLFTEPSIHGPYLEQLGKNNDDDIFVQASAGYGRVVQSIVFSSQAGGTAETWPAGLDKPLFELRNFESIIDQYERLNQHHRSQTQTSGKIKALFPLNKIRDSSAIIGNVTGWGDSDDVFRRNNLFSVFDGKAVPGLAAASLIISGEDNKISYNEKRKAIEWGDRVIPVDRHGRSVLRFRGELDRYHPYWAWQVLQCAQDFKSGKYMNNYPDDFLRPEDFRDRYIFFGFYAQGLYDIFSSPVSSVYPGVGMHITMLDNLLSQDFIRESPAWIDFLLIVLAIIIVVILALYCSKVYLSVGGTAIVFALLLGSALVLYNSFSLWIPMAAPLIAVLLAFIITSVYNYATEGRKKRFIKSAFSQYLSPAVIENIIADPSKLNLGGETREMTAIFTDIQRFSSISEALQKEYAEDGPKVLVNLLNLYLTEMSDIILDNKGTIDKYEGDAIIAFFGAPVWSKDHASLACRSALSMKKREADLLDRVMDPDGEFCKPLRSLIETGVIRPERPLYTRLGINSGNMVVGNMGTPNKMNYTIMGNAVNLSARLEGVNKQYNTGGILISEYTKNQIGDEFLLRGLSRVRVVGIDTPLRLYELLCLREEASGETLDMTAKWEQGFRLYEGRDFTSAKNIFSAVYRKDASDKVAKLYLDRCEKFLAAPPSPEKWDDGVDSLTEK